MCFVHQSFVDYFIAEKMFNDYYSDKDVLSIIGGKDKQTPSRRYQIQMLLQEILSYSNEDFLKFGNELLRLEEVRYYVKYIFYELLSQIENPDVDIQNFVLSNINDKTLINIVVFSRKQYISILRDNDILDNWYNSSDNNAIVIDLIKSISPYYDDKDIAFIRRYALNTEVEAMQFSSCFWHDINQDSNDMFQLRMEIYRRYPNVAKSAFFNLRKMLKKCEMRTIEVLSFWLSEKIKNKESNLFGYEEDLLVPDDDIFIYHGNEVLDELLCYVPKKNVDSYYREWSIGYYINSKKANLERICIEIIKKANIAIIKDNSNYFWNRYQPILDKGDFGSLYTEILLDGFYYLSDDDSNRIMQCLIKCQKDSLIDVTSRAKNDLELLKKVLRKHSEYCNQEILNEFVNQVISYKPKGMIEDYKRRIDQNKTKEYKPVFWTFWGDFQYEILQSIFCKKLNNQGTSLLAVLNRRFGKYKSRYDRKPYGYFGSVSSPVSEKVISINQWLQIITNSKLNNRNRGKTKETKGGFIESSIEMFANDFRLQVVKEPKEMINLVLENKTDVLVEYVNAMFSGVEQSELLDRLDEKLLINMLITFPYELNSLRARDFCQIVGKRKDILWPKVILDTVIDIALYHTSPDDNELNITISEEKETNICDAIQTKALNCVRGEATRAIGELLWEHKQLYNNFKKSIEILSNDANIVIRYASLWALWPVYNIERGWASNLILNVYKSDIKLCSFLDTRNMFHLLYSTNKEDIRTLIVDCIYSDEKKLKRVGVYSLVEMYFIHNDFQQIVNNILSFDKKQAEYALEMIIVYFNVEKYCDEAKRMILEFANKRDDRSQQLARLFYDEYIVIGRDKDFLLELVNTNVGKHFISGFISFLEKQSVSIIDFADIIIVFCRKILNNSGDEIEDIRMRDNSISKLIISLYDEAINTRKDIALQCMDLWDVMFEKQFVSVREISRQLMDR